MHYKIKIIKWIWVLLAVGSLIVTLYYYDGTPNSDVEMFLIYAMLFLTFPGGFVVLLGNALLSYAAYEVFSITYQVSYAELTLEWIAYFILGYFQWFKLLPHLAGKKQT